MFRFKKWMPLGYNLQGYIYFLCINYHRLPETMRETIRRICDSAGGQYHAALLTFLTTEKGATEICMRHHISERTLERVVRKFYLEFAKTL